jgi:hypothetical protein
MMSYSFVEQEGRGDMTLTDHSQKTWLETLLFVLILPFFYQKIRAIMRGEGKPSLEDQIRGELRRNTLRIDPEAEDEYVHNRLAPTDKMGVG